jgi:hypothetical protein
MTEIRRVNDLEIAEDFEFQKRSWVVQRFGWGGMAILSLAGLLGLLGSGLASQATKGQTSDRMWLEYERFERFQSPVELKVHVKGDSGKTGSVTIWFDRDYLEKLQLQQVTPEPEKVEVAENHLVYTFRTVKPNQENTFTFYFETQKFGLLSGSIGLERDQNIKFSQFVFP